ncbi:MAG: peptidyl-prolyl cis-trans isomerase, partial [Solirubrobacterales bacterium]
MRGRLSGLGAKQAAAVLGGFFVVLVVLIAVFGDIGKADVPDDAVAEVDGTEITQEQFDAGLQQAALRQGLQEPPAPDDPQFEAIRDEAMNNLLDIEWIQGEAERRGIEASDEEVQREFEQTKEENFDTEKEFQQFLQQSGFTQEDIDLRVRLQLLSEKIQAEITEAAAGVSDSDAEEFYEANKSQFEQPESRNVRLVLNPDRAEADRAAEQLGEDNSPENWDEVAKELSTDNATKDSGGVREAVVEGTFDPALDTAIFDAPQGEVEGPIETPQGFYVFQVDEVTDARTVPIDEARQQIDQQLQGQVEQEVFSDFLADYRDRWTELTVCADDYLVDRCDNFDAEAQPCPDESLPPEQQQQQLEQGCPPPVISASPGAPGSVLPFTPVQGQPQRPHPAGEAAEAPASVPPGAI